MEYCDGGDIGHLIQRCLTENCHFEEEFIWRCLYHLCNSISTINSVQIPPCDYGHNIKTTNVLLDIEGNLKLVGLGCTRMKTDVAKGTRKKSVISSIACLLYELCTLRPPRYKSESQYNHIPPIYTRDLQTIISFMLNIDHEHDYNSTIEIIMQHPTVLSNVANRKKGFPKLVPNCSPNPMTITSIFERDTTYDLRKDLFYNSLKVQKTPDPRIVRNEQHSLRKASSETGIRTKSTTLEDPNENTQEIFNKVLQKRLIAIKNRETFLRKKEDNLKRREYAIQKREKKLSSNSTTTAKQLRPMKRSMSFLDMSTLTVEPNDTIITPTIAKIDATAMPRPNGFQCKVSFKSSERHLNSVDSENRPLSTALKGINNMPSLQKTDISVWKSVEPSIDTPIVKRKSIFGFLNFNNKKHTTTKNSHLEHQKNKPCDIVATKWTAETKRTAFEMLAIMNAKTKSKSTENLNDPSVIDDMILNDKIVRHDRKRQSMIMLKRNHEHIFR